MLSAKHGFKFGHFDPAIHSVFRVDGPAGSGRQLAARYTEDFKQGFPFGTRCEGSPGSTMCNIYYAPRDFCNTVMQPYTLEEVVEFVNASK